MDQALPWYTEAAHRHVALHRVGPDARASSLGTLTLTFARSALRDYKESEQAKHALFVILALAFGSLLVLVRVRGRLARGSTRSGVVVGVVAGLGIAWLIAWVGDAGRARIEGRVPAQGPDPRDAHPDARRVALLAHAGHAPSQRRAAPQGDGDRQERARQRQAREGHRDGRGEHPRRRVDRGTAQAQRRLSAAS